MLTTASSVSSDDSGVDVTHRCSSGSLELSPPTPVSAPAFDDCPCLSDSPWVRVVEPTGDRLLWLSLELRGYDPSEISVTLDQPAKCVRISAKTRRLCKHSWITRSFQRDIALPQSLCFDGETKKMELRCGLCRDGLVVVVSIVPRGRQPPVADTRRSRAGTYDRQYLADFEDGYGLVPTHKPLPRVNCRVITE